MKPDGNFHQVFCWEWGESIACEPELPRFEAAHTMVGEGGGHPLRIY